MFVRLSKIENEYMNPSTAFRGPPPFDKGGKGGGLCEHSASNNNLYYKRKE